MYVGNSSFCLDITFRNKYKSLNLCILHTLLVFCIYFTSIFINFENAYSQTDPTLEIKIDTTNKNFPLNISILNNTKSNIAQIKIKVVNPTKILSFQNDTNQFIAYPIGVSGFGIRPRPNNSFFPIGNDIMIANLMTDNSNNQQVFNIDFLDVSENVISQQTINLNIPNTEILANPCYRKVIDISTGVDELGNLLPKNEIDSSWIAAIGDFKGLPTQSTVNVYILNPVSTWFKNTNANWLGWGATNPNMPNGFYTSWKPFCVNKDNTEILINIYCNTDDRGAVYLVFPDGNEILLGNSATYNAKPSEIIYKTILNYGTYYLRVSTENSGGGPTGFHLNSGSNISVINGGSISLPSYNCCIPEPTLNITNIDFGKIKIGEVKDSLQAITIQNLSSFPLEITETKHNLPNFIDFSTIAGGGSFTLAPNEIKLMDLRFSPSSVGSTSGTLEFHFNGFGSPAVVELLGEGLKRNPIIQGSINPFLELVCENESINQIKIENIGDDVLIINEFNIIGVNQNDFIINQTLPLIIKPDSIVNIPIIFRPSNAGEKIANLEIKSNSNIDSLLIISLSGKKELIALSVSKNIDLGKLCPNESKQFDVVIDNIGTKPTSVILTNESEILRSNSYINLSAGNQTKVSCEFTGLIQEGSFSRVITLQDTCGALHKINITGIIEIPKLSNYNINLTSVVGKSITQKVKIANISNRDVIINSINGLQAPFNLINNPLPLIILANSSAELEFEFTPIDENPIIQYLSVIGEPCSIISYLNITGNGIGAKMELLTSSKEAYTGEIIDIPIRLINSQNLQLVGINSINTHLSFNPTLLYPLDYSPVFIDDTTAFIKLESLAIIDTMNVEITKVKFRVGLGNRTNCELKLSNVETIGGTANVNLIDGKFTLLGVCYDGGVRLLYPNTIVSMANISPNPVNSIISIDLNLIEIGNTEVSIYNLLGEKVKSIFSKNIIETGSISINSDLSDLSNGQYVVVFTTPTHTEKQNIMILK